MAALTAPTLELLEWVAHLRGDDGGVAHHCPRLTAWEHAVGVGLVGVERASGVLAAAGEAAPVGRERPPLGLV